MADPYMRIPIDVTIDNPIDDAIVAAIGLDPAMVDRALALFHTADAANVVTNRHTGENMGSIIDGSFELLEIRDVNTNVQYICTDAIAGITQTQADDGSHFFVLLVTGQTIEITATQRMRLVEHIGDVAELIDLTT